MPCAFISGITGQFFRQFALTISVSTVISAFNSLTLSPALTALLLRPKDEEAHANPLPFAAFSLLGGWLAWELLLPRAVGAVDPQSAWAAAMPWIVIAGGALAGTVAAWPLNRVLAGAFHLFNRAFDLTAGGYTWIVGKMLHVTVLVLVVYVGLLVVTYDQFVTTPKGFIPSQDMGYLFVSVQLPNAASTERTAKVLRQMEKMALATPGVLHASGIVGQSFALNAIGPNFGTMFVNLEPYHERRDPDKSSMAILGKLFGQFGTIPEARIQVFPPPPIRGVGRAGGFAMVIEDRGDAGMEALQEQAENLMALANQEPRLAGVFTVFESRVPMLKVEPDMREAMKKGVNLHDFAETLQIYQGSQYVNDINLFGRTWQVIIQAEPQFRDQVEDIPKLKVRNASGNMVPLGSFASIGQHNGPLVLPRYNMYTAATLQGAGKPGVSSRDAIDIMEQLANRELPPSMAYEWTDMAFLELNAGNTAMIIFGLAVVMVFLVLAAQYESWSLPLAIILVVPMCLLSAIIGVNLAKMDINIFTQIGFVVLVGLASKNAILIVEFAKKKREAGEPRRLAILDACRLRLRPIIMTSVAFILGVVPLMMAHGAGAEMRQTLGTAVFSGMLGVTLFGIFLTPVFFNAIDWAGGTRVFASRAARLSREFTLDLLTLKPVRRLHRRWRQDAPAAREPRPAKSPPPEPVLRD